MNAIVSGCTHRLSALRQREPIGDTCAYDSKPAVWCWPSRRDSNAQQRACHDRAYLDSEIPSIQQTVIRCVAVPRQPTSRTYRPAPRKPQLFDYNNRRWSRALIRDCDRTGRSLVEAPLLPSGDCANTNATGDETMKKSSDAMSALESLANALFSNLNDAESKCWSWPRSPNGEAQMVNTQANKLHRPIPKRNLRFRRYAPLLSGGCASMPMQRKP